MTAPWLIPPVGARAEQAARIAAAIPRIDTPRLHLRPAALSDYATYESICFDGRWPHGDAALGPKDAWLDFAQMIAGWLLRGTGLYAIEDRAKGRVLGFISLNHEAGDAELELGWFVTPQAEGQGIAFEAATAVLDHAARHLGLATLVSYTGRDNPRSVRLAERLGATRDAAAEAALGDATLNVYRHNLEPAP